MRIAYFTESLLPHVDGVSLTLARLFATLEERGVDFTIFSPFAPRDAVSWGQRVRVVRYVRFPPYPDYRVSLPFSPTLRATLESYAPSLIHVVSPTPMAVWAQRRAARLGVPVVASFHTDFVAYFRYYRLRGLEPLGWTAEQLGTWEDGDLENVGYTPPAGIEISSAFAHAFDAYPDSVSFNLGIDQEFLSHYGVEPGDELAIFAAWR